MADLKNIVYLSNEDYETLVTTGTVTIGGDTLTYDETNNVYVTPEETASSTNDGLMSAADKAKLDGIAPGAGVDTNQTVKVGSTTFGANDAVSFTGTGAASVTANATTKTININVSGADNQRIKADNVTFGANDIIDIVAGDNITVTGLASGTGAPKITIAATGGASPTHKHPFTPAGSITLDNTKSTGIEYVQSITSNAATGTPTTKGLHKGTTTVLTGVKASGTANAAPHTHTHTVTVSGTTGVNSGTAVTAITGVGATGTATVNTNAIKSVTLSASTDSDDGPAYISAISGGSAVSPTTKYMKFSAGTTPKSGATPNHESTDTGNNSASETVNTYNHTHAVTLTANTQSATGRITYVESISGSAPSLTGTKTFITGVSGGSGSLTSNTTASGGTKYVEDISYTKQILEGTTSFNINAIKSATLSASNATSGSGTSARRTLTLSVTTSPADKDSVTISNGAVDPTIKYLHHTHTAASSSGSGTVGISGGSYSATTKYLSADTSASNSTVTVAKDTHTHKYDKTTSISLTNGTAPSINFNTGVTTDTPYVSAVSGGSAVSATTRYMKVNPKSADTTTVITGVEATDTASVAPSDHTHSYGSSTALTTSTNSGSAVKAVTGVAANGTASAITSLTVNATPATGDITYLESYVVSGGGASAATKHLNATFNGSEGTTGTPQ